MARYTNAVCRQCRREGTRLYLKGERCYTDKCAVERRNQPPGMHAKNMRMRSRTSAYRDQLRQKQKVKRTYGVLERQFRKYFEEADRMKGITGTNLLQLLERRLDNVLFRLGYAASRREARQVVRHGHVEVNGRKVNVPSFSVRAGDAVSVREGSREHGGVKTALEFNKSMNNLPAWLERDESAFSGRVARLPERADIPTDFQEQLIVELYSK